MSKLLKKIRLLPVVMALGAPLLVLKGAGLIRAAEAQDTGVSALQSSSMPDQMAANDPAADGNPSSSAAEVGVLTALSKRRAQLDAQTQSISAQSNLLAATEARIDSKIAQLKALQAAIQQLLAQRDAEQEKQVAALVKTYSTMKAKDAARIFNTLDDSVLIPVAQEMKPDILGPILASMNADAAQKLTVKLANRLQLPDAPPPEPSPQQQSANAPTPDPSALANALAPAVNGATMPASMVPALAAPAAATNTTPAATPAPASGAATPGAAAAPSATAPGKQASAAPATAPAAGAAPHG
jgi:flagellar motility protein MotE (MotC chaperone)